jgi:hypothetical protein
MQASVGMTSVELCPQFGQLIVDSGRAIARNLPLSLGANPVTPQQQARAGPLRIESRFSAPLGHGVAPLRLSGQFTF